MIIRKVQSYDIPQIYHLLYEEWGIDVADRIIAEVNDAFELGTFKPHYYVAMDGNFMLGFAGFVPSHILHGVYELNGIVVTKAYKRTGVGSALTKKRLEEIKKLSGTLIILMTKQVDFFSKYGFDIVADYDGWVLMIKKLGVIEFE